MAALDQRRRGVLVGLLVRNPVEANSAHIEGVIKQAIDPEFTIVALQRHIKPDIKQLTVLHGNQDTPLI